MDHKEVAGAVLGLLVVWSTGARADGTWADGWYRAPLPTTVTTSATTKQATVPATLSNQTLRLIVWTTLGGAQVRVKLTNQYSATPLSVGAARVALRQSGGTIVSSSSRLLTFGGSSSVTIAPGGEVWSDPAPLAVAPRTDLALSLYLPGTFTPATFHPVGLKTSYLSTTGDFTSSAAMPAPAWWATRATTMVLFGAEVQVLSATMPTEIVALGDSITDGYCSSVDANGSWPDLLAKRLPALADGTPVGVINAGISSNRFAASDGAGLRGLLRLPELLARPGVGWVVLLEGVNDISYEHATANDLITAYQSAVAQAHAAGVEIIGVPILPMKHSVKDTPDNQATRTAVNAWIRSSGVFDAVIDFEPAVGDPNDPGSMKSGLTCDHVHPNQAGYQTMANAIDLTLFE